MSLLTYAARWWQRTRQRRADVAARVAHLERVLDGRAKGGADDWDKIFGRTGQGPHRFSHRGRCGVCGAAVDFHASRCPHCQAEWVETGGRHSRRSAIIFVLLSLSVALPGGIACRYGAGKLLENPERNPDFVSFAQNYLWIAGTVLILVVATYVYERLDIAPSGHWQAAKRLDKPGALRHTS